MAQFSVMTWNVENLFRVGSPSGPKTKEDYDRKLASLVKVISELDPTVVALQEIGSPEAFDDLASQLDSGYPHVQLSTNPDARGIRVAFLSKLAIEQHAEIVDFPPQGLPAVPGIDAQGNLSETTRLSRGALQVLVKPRPDLSVWLLTAHLKSKLLSFPSANGKPRFTPKDENERSRTAGVALLKRTAEAVAIRVRANELLQGNSGTGLIVLGDLNDVTNAATTQILNGPQGSEIDTPGFNHPDRGDDVRLFNLAARIPEERRFSRINQGNPELIDHILVSQELLPGDPRRLPTVDSHLDMIGKMPSVTPDPTERRGKPASDHAPITAMFEL